MRRETVPVDPDVPNWLLTKRGGVVTPALTILCGLLLVASIVASIAVGGGSLTVVAALVVLAGAAGVVWAVVDLAWWSRGDRRRIVKLPREPGA
jgi:hypothetical protein